MRALILLLLKEIMNNKVSITIQSIYENNYNYDHVMSGTSNVALSEIRYDEVKPIPCTF